MPDSSDNVNSGARASAVDWSRPIEAVHEDGRVVPATARVPKNGITWVEWQPPKNILHRGTFDAAGKATAEWSWRIRNVQPTTPELDPALWDRMEALVRRMAADNRRCFIAELDEARAIAADLPKPVDPDLIEARKIVAARWSGLPEIGGISSDNVLAGRHDTHDAVACALAAIKRGRQLATPEVSHVG